MNAPETLLETEDGSSPEETSPAMTLEAPRSWDPAGRRVPAAKLDWTECLAFRQVRGVDVAPDPERPADESSGEA